jgi:HEAT repeat protein
VWRQLSGVTDRRLLQPLLDALAFDTSVNAREEAAETLSDFLPDPAAESALRHAADNDPDEGVREDAREYLDGR